MKPETEILSELATGFTAGIELLLNRALKLDPENLEKLQSFDDKVIQIKLLGLELDFYLQVSSHGIMLMNQYAGKADTILAGRPLKFAEMALGDARKVLFSGEVTITGDVELGQNFKRWIDNLDIDWEEQLSTITGDVVAHKAGNIIRSTTAWGLQALSTLSQGTADYLKEESEQLPIKDDMAEFVNQVDEFRDSVARLEARLANLPDSISN